MANKIPHGGPDTFGLSGEAVAAGATDLPDNVKAIVCTAAGDVTIVPYNNANATTISFTGCPVGFSPPFVPRRVTALTGSWATVAD